MSVRVLAEVPIGHASCVEALQSRFAVVEVATFPGAPYLYSATVMELDAVPFPTLNALKGVVEPIPIYPPVVMNSVEVPIRVFVAEK